MRDDISWTQAYRFFLPEALNEYLVFITNTRSPRKIWNLQYLLVEHNESSIKT